VQGLRVKCNGCGKVLHETTDKYDPNITPNGSMVRLIDPWKSWGWSAFDDEGEAISTTSAVMMSCPACSAPLVLNGKLNIVAEPEKPKTQAEINQERITAEFPDEPLSDIILPLNYAPNISDLTCKICGKVCKSKLGLGSHMRSHGNE
jgi:ribosomal protein S27E